MKHWNYRVVKQESVFGVYECYYDSAGRIHSCSKDACPATGDTLDELKATLERMQRAFKSPTLNFEELPEPNALADEEDVEEDDDDES
jgi:hypothetical protein